MSEVGIANTLYNNLITSVEVNEGLDVASSITAQMFKELGSVSTVEQQALWLDEYLKAQSSVEKLFAKSFEYRSGSNVGVYGISETASVSTSAIDSTASNVITTSNAFGTKIIEEQGVKRVSLQTVGKKITSGTTGKFIVGEVLPFIGAVASGVVLGVQVDKILYDSNPDYWQQSLPTINPETWDDIILGHDTKIPLLHNTETGISYIHENMIAYTSLLGKRDDWFTGYDEKSDTNFPDILSTTYANSVTLYSDNEVREYTSDNPNIKFIVKPSGQTNYYEIVVASKIFNTGNITYKRNGVTMGTYPFNNTAYTYDNKTVYTGLTFGFDFSKFTCSVPLSETIDIVAENIISWVAFYGDRTIHHGNAPVGITKTGISPDLSDVSTLQDAKLKLRETYPNLYDNALEVPYVNNGIDTVNTWLPVALPTTNDKPSSENYNQSDNGDYPDENTKNDANNNVSSELIIPTPPNPINPFNPPIPTPLPVTPSSPVDTGLGAVYIPTVQQLKQFSMWLWSDNFIEQIKKLFSDPMQAIIGLHQVYFTPTDSGATTIHAGYLDSGVDSNYTEVRYYNIDCGTINLRETFGNVFDYDPYTTIEIYLPFIGIVPLKVGDVMRASLNVVYTCDILTGACLCNIYVIRDGAKCVLYTYGGNCAVNYPLSSGSYMGIVSALAGVGLSIGTAIATGGASIPLSIGGGAVSMLNAHTNVKTSGGYGGNTGAMGIKKPYLIVKNTLTAMPQNYPRFIGNPYNDTTKLSSCSGYTKVKSVHVENISVATDYEKNMIETLLQTGVII